MEKALVTFSFDDGRVDNYTIAYPILKKYGLPATFNITTGFVEGKFEGGKLTPASPMNLDMVKRLYADDTMEIAGHGYWHKNELSDILEGVNTLRSHLGTTGWGVRTFASPGTNLNLSEYAKFKPELKKNGIECVRLSLRLKSYARLKTFMRKVARVTHVPLFFRWAYKDTLMTSINDDVIYSVPVLSSTTTDEIRCLINYAVKKKTACVLMFHSIVDDGCLRDNWDYESSKFTALCKFLCKMQQESSLKVVTTYTLYQNLKKA